MASASDWFARARVIAHWMSSCLGGGVVLLRRRVTAAEMAAQVSREGDTERNSWWF